MKRRAPATASRQPTGAERLLALLIKEIRELRQSIDVGAGPLFFRDSSGCRHPVSSITRVMHDGAAVTTGHDGRVEVSGDDARALMSYLDSRQLVAPEDPEQVKLNVMIPPEADH